MYMGILTKEDLEQIKRVVRREVEAEIGNKMDDLDSRLLDWRMSIQTDIREVKDRVKNVEIGITQVSKDLQKVHRSLKREIKLVSNFQDRANLATRERVKGIEEKLGIPSTQ